MRAQRSARQLVELTALGLDLFIGLRDRSGVGRAAGDVLVSLRPAVDLPVEAGDPLPAVITPGSQVRIPFGNLSLRPVTIGETVETAHPTVTANVKRANALTTVPEA